jgi:transposase
MQKEHLELSQADHDYLRALTTTGQVAARTFTRARALLELHRGQTLRAVAESLRVTRQSVAQWRDRYQAGGLQALGENPRSGRPVRINGKQRARLTALACSTPPEGRARWTLRLLADQAVELGLCESLSHTRARQILKKTNSAPI